jgi:Flp pilus assembly protein TadD
MAALTGPLIMLLAAATASDIDHAIDSGRLDQARLMIARSITESGDVSAFEPQQARLAFHSGDFAGALARYQALSSADPRNPAFAEGAGLAALALGKDDIALAALSKAAALPSAGWRTWNGLGVLADRSKEFAEARVNYAKALTIAPGRAEILNNLAWSHFLEGNADAALPYLEQAALADPTSKLFAANLELVLAATADHLPARRQGETVGDYAARLNDAGVVALSRRQERRAIAAFSQAIAVRGAWYERAANNLKLAEGAK